MNRLGDISSPRDKVNRNTADCDQILGGAVKWTNDTDTAHASRERVYVILFN